MNASVKPILIIAASGGLAISAAALADQDDPSGPVADGGKRGDHWHLRGDCTASRRPTRRSAAPVSPRARQGTTATFGRPPHPAQRRRSSSKTGSVRSIRRRS